MCAAVVRCCYCLSKKSTDDDEDYEDYDDEWETDSEDEGMPGEGFYRVLVGRGGGRLGCRVLVGRGRPGKG